MNEINEEKITILDEAFGWKTIEDKLTNNSKELFKHLLKLYYWSHLDPNDIKHWMHEVWNLCHRVDKQKGSNKYPDSEKIYNAIWNKWGDNFDILKDELNKDSNYSRLPRIAINDNAKNFCREYISWLADQLSTKERITSYEVYNRLESLLDKYLIMI